MLLKDSLFTEIFNRLCNSKGNKEFTVAVLARKRILQVWEAVKKQKGLDSYIC